MALFLHNKETCTYASGHDSVVIPGQGLTPPQKLTLRFAVKAYEPTGIVMPGKLPSPEEKLVGLCPVCSTATRSAEFYSLVPAWLVTSAVSESEDPVEVDPTSTDDDTDQAGTKTTEKKPGRSKKAEKDNDDE